MTEQTQEAPRPVSELLQDLHSQVDHKKPVGRGQLNPEARCLDALRAGEELAVLKRIKWGGQTYYMGDTFSPSLDYAERISSLAERGFFIPASEYHRGREGIRLLKFYRNEVQPVEAHLNRLGNEITQARADLNEARALVTDRQNELRTKQAAYKDTEEELRTILEGEELLGEE